MIVIENKRRPTYIDAIENALLHNTITEYYSFMFQAIEKSLDDYLDAIKESKIEL